MERKIGEVFECDGKKLQVIEDPLKECDGCYFVNKGGCAYRLDIRGCCEEMNREDRRAVIFKEIKDINEENKQSILEENKQSILEENKQSILDEAKAIVEGSRQSDYGDAANNFECIATIVNSLYPELNITSQQCCMVLIAVKLIREGYRHKRDNLVDLCGYAHIMNEINESEKEGE